MSHWNLIWTDGAPTLAGLSLLAAVLLYVGAATVESRVARAVLAVAAAAAWWWGARDWLGEWPAAGAAAALGLFASFAPALGLRRRGAAVPARALARRPNSTPAAALDRIGVADLPPDTLEAARIGLWRWDLDENRIRFSPSWPPTIGVRPEDLSHDPDEWLDRIHPNYVAEVRQSIAAHLAGETDRIECDYRVRTADGQYLWVLNRAHAVRDDQGRPRALVGCQVDVTSVVEVEKKVLHDAYVDRLTALPNRRAFMPLLDRACRRYVELDEPFALLFLDLNRFKAVNDSLGHAVGDELLAAAADRLRNAKRSGDIVARLGGDEFVLLLPNVGAHEEALRVAHRVHDSLCKPFKLSGREVRSGASIGVALSTGAAATTDDMLRGADQAMYRAKASRQGVALFSPEMRLVADRAAAMGEDLAGAAKRSELELHFQPVMCLRRGAVSSVEALLRWRRPGGYRLSAGEFVPLAESTGSISAIGEWAIRAACVYRAAWLKQGYTDFSVSVNVSTTQLHQEEFGPRTLEILRKTGLPAKLLQVEIREDALDKSSVAAAKNLALLIERGVRVAIDNWGSGESSLSRLTSIPLHSVKLHREFLAGLENSRAKQDLVGAVVNLAHTIRVEVGAEGVESPEMLRKLQAERFDAAQGYFIGRPMPAGRLSPILIAAHRREIAAASEKTAARRT